MGKYTILGCLCWLGGFVLLGFQGISSVMNPGEVVWKSLNLLDAVGSKNFTWIDSISIGFIQNSVDYVVTMPLFLLLIALGVIFFILNAFLGRIG
ncbi:MAG: hypothetical protein HN737_11125 [Desulfobacterales bacterium]|jgi:hypothetical protein|nr:hypothetical protein [Desulfobacteraceae bacterium]MBT4364521.1 hypothetical protein [Desulfobacteraceae bacterium]MBT7086527.1 hypothetical protein [Desulfobacterales bacterium]MBT7697947.1 hypothetical protein [Desulfobacterales bacterium]